MVYLDIFDSDLKEFFNYVASEEEKIMITSYFQDKFFYRLKRVLFFLHKYNDLYNFWINLPNNIINLSEVELQQVEFLKDLMNGFKVYKTIKKPKKELNYKAEDHLYLILLGNPNKTVNNIF